MNPDKRWFRNPQLSMPPAVSAQQEMVAILDSIDCKIDSHRRKRTVPGELLSALLHKLIWGEIRVVELDLSSIFHRSDNCGDQR